MNKKIFCSLLLAVCILFAGCANSAGHDISSSNMSSSNISSSGIFDSDVAGSQEIDEPNLNGEDPSSSDTDISATASSEVSQDANTALSQNSSKVSSNSQGGNNNTPTGNKPVSYDKSIFLGIDPLRQGVDIDEEEWESFRELGIKRLRINMQWINFGKSETDPDYFLYDETVQRAKKEGIEIMIVLAFEGIDSLKPTKDSQGRTVYPDPTAAMTNYARNVITHFAPMGVSDYELWHAPNSNNYYVTPQDYAKMVTTVYEKCKYTEKWANGNKVNLCAFSLTASDYQNLDGLNESARSYIKAFYKTSYYKVFKAKYGHSPFDAVSVSPWDSIAVDKNGNITKNNLKKCLQVNCIDVMKEYGDENIPIWITMLGEGNSNRALNAKLVGYYIQEAAKIEQLQYLYWYKMRYDGSNMSLVVAPWQKTEAYYAFKDAAAKLK